MRRMQRIADQHVAVVRPVLAADHRELPPYRLVGDQVVFSVFKPVRPEPAHVFDECGVRQIADGAFSLLPGAFRRLDDPGAHPRLVLIGAENPDAVIVLGKIEGEGIVRFGRAQPGEAVFPHVDLRPEDVDKRFAHDGIDTVRADDQVGVDVFQIVDFVRIQCFDPDFVAAPLQNLQQFHAPAAAEPVAGRAHGLAVQDEVDLVPIGELTGDRVVTFRIAGQKMIQRLVGKHHTEAERVVRAVALVDRHVVGRPGFLGEKGEVEPAGPAPDDGDAHGSIFRYLFNV